MLKKFTLFILLLTSLRVTAQINVVNLTCEYLKNPEGIDVQAPRFFWQLESEKTGQAQTAYRVIVASTQKNIENNVGDMYDSHQTLSSNNTQIIYGGKPLQPASDYYWKIMVWDKNKKASAWSETARFTTGLFTQKDWKNAQWIAWKPQEQWEKAWWERKDIELQCTELVLPSYFGARMNMWERYHFNPSNPYDPSPLYRKQFTVKKTVKNARLFISGLGYNELFINGKRIGDHVLDPGWTNYKKTILYTTYDVTQNLQNGENAIGVMLGRGNYGMMAVDHWGFYKKGGYIGQPKLLCCCKITYTDGTEENIVSDVSWKVTGGPIVYDGPHMGEIYDATKEIKNWNKPDFTDSGWDKAVAAPSPGGALKAQLIQPIRVVKTWKPEKVETRGWVQWADAGTEMAGWIRLKVNAPKGTRIDIYYGENENPQDYGQPGGYQQMAYVAKGEKDEIAECHFSYKGFRYVNIVGYPGTLTADDIEICQVNSDVSQVGTFSSSDTTLNAIHRICMRSVISNLYSIPTDCPHREKNGWMGDAVTGMEYAMANYDMAALLTKFTHDIFDTQDAEGRMSVIAPDNDYAVGLSPLWASAGIHIPWYMYQYYGDTRLFETYWNQMKLFTQSVWKYNGVTGKKGIFTDVLADWSSPFGNISEEGPEVYTTMNFYLVLTHLWQMAVVLGKTADATEFERQAGVVKDAIYKYCFDADKQIFTGITPSSYRQGPNAMALQYGIVKPADKKQVMNRLLTDIRVNRDFHFYGGIFTGLALWKLLPENNESELAYKVAVNDTYPGYGFMLKHGATALWEHWTNSDSHIHYFMGFVDNFLTRQVAGIHVNDKAPRFSEVLFTPNFINELDHAEAEYQSIQGKISIAWVRTNANACSLKLEVPCNTTGKLILPVKNLLAEEKNGKEIAIKNDGAENYILLPSGKHEIRIFSK